MLVLFGILVIIASVILGMIVLIQNPKGGGLSASFGGFGNQIMGVKQTTDVLGKRYLVICSHCRCALCGFAGFYTKRCQQFFKK